MTIHYRYLMEKHKQEIKSLLAKSIEGCTSRYEREREGIKCFVKYAVQNQNVYNIIWGSLSIDKNMFIDYYVSFAESYAHSLSKDPDEVNATDHTTVAYALMGVSNFLGLRAMFEGMNEADIDAMIDQTLMPSLLEGVLKKN